MSRASEDRLSELHSGLTEFFIEALAVLSTPVDTGMAEDMQVMMIKFKMEKERLIPSIIKFLKDNEITCDISVIDEMGDLKSELEDELANIIKQTKNVSSIR